MNEILLLKGNPSKRSGSRKRRSAAQRAATKRMLAANRARFHHNPKRRKARKASAAPVSRKRKSSARKTQRRVSRRSFGGSSGIVSMLKTGAIMGGGAVVADIGMGLVVKLFPTMPAITSPVNADGTTNYAYYAAKGVLIYGMHRYGGRVTRHASTMAAGAAAVMLYQFIRGMLPQDGTIPLGYFNPGMIANGGSLGKMGRIMRNPGAAVAQNLQGVSRIVQLPTGSNRGAVAMQTIRNVSGLARR